MSNYSYLFKLIVIGDTSTRLSLCRCRQKLYAASVPREKVQVRPWHDHRCWVRIQDHLHKWEVGQAADLGHSIFVGLCRQDSRPSNLSLGHTIGDPLESFSSTISPIESPLTTSPSGSMRPRHTPTTRSRHSLWPIKPTSNPSKNSLRQESGVVWWGLELRQAKWHEFHGVLG